MELTILRRHVLVIAAVGIATCMAIGRGAAPAAPTSAPVVPPPSQYVCSRTTEMPSIDGKLDDAAWANAAWTSDFVDIVTAAKSPLATRVKLLWDDSRLYIAAELREPHLQARIEKRDEPVFRENAFELFFDPDGDHHDYAELQINAINTVADLRMDKPYRDRGKSDAFWDIIGMRTAVRVEGTLNEPADQDTRWTVEIAIPWHALAELRPRGGEGPPNEGAQWRMNFARVAHVPKFTHGQYGGVQGIEYSCWSPQMESNLHAPERWGTVQFSAPKDAEFKTDPPVAAARDLLMRIYGAQREQRRLHGQWARRLEDLQKEIGPMPKEIVQATLRMTRQGWQATAALRTENGLQMWHVREDSKLWRE